MATRTVRLDDEAESALKEVQDATGLPISEVLKRGLHVLLKDVRQNATRTPWDIYREIDSGLGGHSHAPSTDTRRGVRAALKKKLGR